LNERPVDELPVETAMTNLPYRRVWRTTQLAVWLVGIGILLALLFRPVIGVHAFWDVLIPVAPALLVFAPGLWRNICPLASTALFARHRGWSRRLTVSPRWQGRLLLAGVVALFAIVPLRHVTLDTNGPATALTIIALAVAAVTMGAIFEWKSGWCSGACPVHGVERLYGTAPAISPPNAHCTQCHRCVQPCADSTTALSPMSGNGGPARRIAGLLMVGAFPGFVWGWFQVPDYRLGEGWSHLGSAYAWPLLAGAGSLVVYLALRSAVGPTRHALLARVAAAAAVACYYWYRLPALAGFGPFPGDGMLVDLRGTLPAWFPTASHVVTTALFAWWLLLRGPGKKGWASRPAFAADQNS
jgi:hypothetical protein